MSTSPAKLNNMIASSLSQVIEFDRGNLSFKELASDAQLSEAFQLRYKLVVEKLAWVTGDPGSKTETDEFDPHSFHFGCYQNGRLVAYMRMTKEDSPTGTMSKSHFSELWQKHPSYPKSQTADISRLLVDIPALADRNQLAQVLLGLYRLAYGRSHLCRPVIRYWYFITTPKLMRGLKWRLGLPLQHYGSGPTSDGKTTHAAGLDLQSAKRRLFLVAPWRLHYLHKATQHAKPRLVKQAQE